MMVVRQKSTATAGPVTGNGLTIKGVCLFTILLALVPNSVVASVLPHNDWSFSGIQSAAEDTPVDVTRAALIEASFARRQSQLASVPAIPIPTHVAMYDRLHELAAMMPTLETARTHRPVSGHSSMDDDSSSHMGLGMAVDSEELAPAVMADSETISKPAAALSVMVVGDSMTQGQEGDWTWRYRIWEWFRDQNVTVDFVGPYAGTQEPLPPQAPAPPPLYGAPDPPPGPVRSSGGYAKNVSSRFNSDHFSVWGRAAATDKSLIKSVVAKYKADLMLLMLGFNDMGWFYSGPEGTLESIHTLVANARAVNPHMKFAIANVPQRRDMGRADMPINTDLYNLALAKAIPQWATSKSPIELVKLRENYECDVEACPAGYDGLHPNALGDFQIAQAFSRTLVSKFNIGKTPLAIPHKVPERPHPVPSSFRVVSSPGGILATWDPVYGAYGYDVRSRVEGVTGWSEGSVAANRYDALWTFNGSVYDIQVRATFGEDMQSDWTDIGSATAHPQTAPGPINVVIEATATGIIVAFDPPTGPYTDTIIEYNIIFWDKDTDDVFPGAAAFAASPARIDELMPEHRYTIAIVTWNAAGGGFPQFYRDVRVGSRDPAVPENLQIRASDATTAHLTWDPVPEAAGYRVWRHRIDDGSEPVVDNGTVADASVIVSQLSPGTGYYEFCVSAINGNIESPHGECVTAPPFDHAVSACQGQSCREETCSGFSCVEYGLQRVMTQWR